MNRNKKLLNYFTRKGGEVYNKESEAHRYLAPQEFFKLINQYLKKDYKLVLDVGVGTGKSSVPLINQGKEVYGIDFSEKMIGSAKKYNFKDLRIGNILLGLPYADNFFDVVISVGACNLYKNLGVLMKEMVRVTRNNGLIGFTVEGRGKSQPKKWLAKEAGVYVYKHSKEDITSLIQKLDVDLLDNKTIVAYRLQPPKYKEKDILYDVYILRKS